jgi:hypothetical protein
MTASSEVSFSDLVMQTVKTNARQLVTASAVLTGLGFILTFCILFSYLHTIGYPSLMSSALDNTAALLPWILIAVLLLTLYLASLMVTSAFFAAALVPFKKTSNVQSFMALALILPSLAGITAMVYSVIIRQRSGVIDVMALSAAAVIIAMLVMLLIPKFRAAIRGVANKEDPPVRNAMANWLTTIVGLVGTIWGTALSAMFPMLLLIKTYPWPKNSYELYKFACICVITSAFGLLPAVAFYLGKDGLWSRARYTLGGVVLVIAGALYFAPATIPMIVDSAAELIGIKSLKVSPFMIKDTYAAEDFDSQWGEVSTRRSYPVVEAFPLFTLGDLLLLCPKLLAPTDLENWPSVTHACLIVDAKTTKKMPEKTATGSKGQDDKTAK